MYIGALMPLSPIRPMNSPWPILSGQGGPMVEMVRPMAIISEPPITVQRMPIRLAMRPIRMPPTAAPSQVSDMASAGTERVPFTSAAMVVSATEVIQLAPNAIVISHSATDAVTHEARVSMVWSGEGVMMWDRRCLFNWQLARTPWWQTRGSPACCIAPKCVVLPVADIS